jgi:hypothetical protein
VVRPEGRWNGRSPILITIQSRVRALNLLPLQGKSRKKRLTQGSAKPPPWAKFSYPFGATNANNAGYAVSDCLAVHCFPTELQKRETDPRELNQFLEQRLGLHYLVGERPPDVKRFVL